MNVFNILIVRIFQFLFLVLFIFMVLCYFGFMLLLPLDFLYQLVLLLTYELGDHGFIYTLLVAPIVIWGGVLVYRIPELTAILVEPGIAISKLGFEQNRRFERIVESLKIGKDDAVMSAKT